MVEEAESFEEEIEEKAELQPPQLEEKPKGARPDFRVVQPEVDQEGKTVFKEVGAMWKSVSKQGNIFYTLRIGNLRLLVFPNTR